MANSIALVQKYIALLDEKYKWESRSSILDAPNELVLETQAPNVVLIPKMLLQGLGDYDRNGGFVSGDATITWAGYTFTQDRGRSFQIDALDDIETMGIAFGKLAGEFIEKHVAPELDAYRFSTYAAGAGNTATPATPVANTIVGYIDTGISVMDDAEVPETGRILFISTGNYNLLKSAPEIERRIDVSDGPKDINRKIRTFDEMIIVKVPQSRFYTSFDFYDGTTGGQEDGGFVPTPVTAKKINFMIIHPSAIMQITKRKKMREFDPDTNQSGDAYKWDYRVYHDAWVFEEKTDGVYLHNEA